MFSLRPIKLISISLLFLTNSSLSATIDTIFLGEESFFFPADTGGFSADGSLIFGHQGSFRGGERPAIYDTDKGEFIDLPAGLNPQAIVTGSSTDGSVLVGLEENFIGEVTSFAYINGVRTVLDGSRPPYQGFFPLDLEIAVRLGYGPSVSDSGSRIIVPNISPQDGSPRNFQAEYLVYDDGQLQESILIPRTNDSLPRHRISPDGSKVVISAAGQSGNELGEINSSSIEVIGGQILDTQSSFASLPLDIAADSSTVIFSSSFEAKLALDGGEIVSLEHTLEGLLGNAFLNGDGTVVAADLIVFLDGVRKSLPGLWRLDEFGDYQFTTLEQLLQDQGVDISLEGWTELNSIRGISADGLKLVGLGIKDQNSGVFLVSLDPAAVPLPPTAGFLLFSCLGLLFSKHKLNKAN